MPDRINFMHDIAASGTDPAQMMAALDRLIAQVVGMRMCTLIRVGKDRESGMRIHSTEPERFPICTPRDMSNRTWQTRIVTDQKILVTNSYEEIAAVFGDAEELRELGYESCLCLPIVVKGKLLGTLNILHEAGHFTPERVAAAEALTMPAAIILMASFELDGIPTADRVVVAEAKGIDGLAVDRRGPAGLDGSDAGAQQSQTDGSSPDASDEKSDGSSS